DNAGSTWTDITGNLTSLTMDPEGAEHFEAITVYNPTTAPGDEVLLVGGLGGVFRTLSPGAASPAWTLFARNLPYNYTNDLVYNAADDVLVAGTFGRGAWTVPNASQTLTAQGLLTIDGDTLTPGAFDTVRLVRDVNDPTLLD